MEEEKKVIGWFTVNGKHVPIFESNEPISSERKRDRDIIKAKEQADQRTKENKLAELEKKKADAKGLLAKAAINTEIEMLKADWKGTKEEFLAHQKAEHDKAVQESLAKKKADQESKQQKELAKKKQLEEELKTQPKDKVEQFKVIQKHNPMTDDYHVGIRKPSDIKTWAEVVKSDSNDGESFAWGDFSKKDAEKALKTGKITIYSSYPIGQGVFVSTSRVQAEQYAGGKGKKVYSKVVPLSEVAWINGDEGQYAHIER